MNPMMTMFDVWRAHAERMVEAAALSSWYATAPIGALAWYAAATPEYWSWLEAKPVVGGKS